MSTNHFLWQRRIFRWQKMCREEKCADFASSCPLKGGIREKGCTNEKKQSTECSLPARVCKICAAFCKRNALRGFAGRSGRVDTGFDAFPGKRGLAQFSAWERMARLTYILFDVPKDTVTLPDSKKLEAPRT